MTYKENSNLILNNSGMPCYVEETNIVRNMDWIVSEQSTTYQKPDGAYPIDPSGITGNAELMYAFTSPGTYYYQVGTQVRYGDYIYFRARNLAIANPYEWYLIEYHIPTGDKIIFQVPDMGWHSYTIGQGAHFCPIAPHILLLYEPYDGFGTGIDSIRKIIFSGSSATMTTELEVYTTAILERAINFFDVVKGSNGHLYGVAWCSEHDILSPPGGEPSRHGWCVYCKDYTYETQWTLTVLDTLPTWSDIDVWNGGQTMLLGDKMVTTNQLEDVDYNDFVTIVTFDVITNTLQKYDWTPGEYRWARYSGPSLPTTTGYFNMVGGSPNHSLIYKFNALNNEWTLVRDLGTGSPTPYCAIFSSKTHAYFWNTITQDFYDAETNTLIGNITLPFVSGATQVSYLIDDNDLIWYYESGAVKAKDFDNTIVYNITLTGFTPKTYTNIHLFNDYIVLQTYSAFAGKEQDYYLVK